MMQLVTLNLPETQPLIWVSNGATSNVNPIADGRPFDFNEPSVLKVIVLMTDGSNTCQCDLRKPYKSGLPYICFHPDEGENALNEVDRNDYSILLCKHPLITNHGSASVWMPLRLDI